MSITVKQGLSGKYFSQNIPDVEVTIGGYRLGVTMETSTDGTSWKEIYNEYLYPIDSSVAMGDLGSLLTPYCKQSLVVHLRVTMTEEMLYTTATNTTVMTAELVYCEADIDTTCEDFTANHFLSILLGKKVTALGRLEYLHYIGTDTATVTAKYSDGTSQSFTATAVGGNSNYTTIEVSAENYVVEGKTLLAYTVTAGARKQDYVLDLLCPDCAPILIFVNSFGVEELFYCTGTQTKAPSFTRTSAYIDGMERNYKIVEKRTFKADTGILNEDMADWFGDLMRSEYVRIVTFNKGTVNIGREVIITESKSEQTNDPDELPRFTFSYNYSQRNHNVVQMQREGRIFDNTFDYTFN